MEIYDISIYRTLQSHTINLLSNYIVTSLPHVTSFTLTHTTLTLFFTDEAVPVSAGVVVPVGCGRKDGATVLVMSVVVRLAFNK